jgi:hypothetical protein
MTTTTTSLDRRVDLLKRIQSLGVTRSLAEDYLIREAQRQLDLADEYAARLNPPISLAARAVYETMIADAERTVEALLGAVSVLRGGE